MVLGGANLYGLDRRTLARLFDESFGGRGKKREKKKVDVDVGPGTHGREVVDPYGRKNP